MVLAGPSLLPNCPAILALEFLSIENESSVALPQGELGVGGRASASCLSSTSCSAFWLLKAHRESFPGLKEEAASLRKLVGGRPQPMTDWEALHTAHLGGAREGVVLWVVKGHSPPLPDAAGTGGLSLTPHPRPASPASPLPSQDFPERHLLKIMAPKSLSLALFLEIFFRF